VIPVVVGSSPISHPIFFFKHQRVTCAVLPWHPSAMVTTAGMRWYRRV